MSNPKHIQDELNNLESNLPFNNNQPFSVPEGYFDGLAAAVLAKVKSSGASVDEELTALSPLLAGIPKITPYSVPSFYFQDNIDSAVGVVQETQSSLLNSISKNVPYAVPQGYFNALPQQILEKISTPKAKVVPLFARTWMRVAAAAIVAGAIFFAGLQLFSSKPVTSVVAQNPVDTTSTQIAQTTRPVIKEVKQASTKDLEAFIETVQVSTPKASKTSQPDNKEAADLLKDVSVNEMKSFLSDLPADDDLLTD